MRVVGFCGPSGAGKTTLIERLIPLLRAQGLRVSVIKWVHSGFDVDKPGKDSWRQRQAGAYEVLVASGERLAKMREFEAAGRPTVHELMRELAPCDWVLIEGYKHADVPKVELFDPALDGTALYPEDPFVVALVTDAAQALPVATQRPVFARDDVGALAQFLLQQGARHEYRHEPTD